MATTSECDPFGCSKCAAVVFIPRASGIQGGVCTQQARGCAGEIKKLGDLRAKSVRDFMAARAITEQPWLTLVFASAKGEVPRG